MARGGNSGPSGASGGNSNTGGRGEGNYDRDDNKNLLPVNKAPTDIFLSNDNVREELKKRKKWYIGDLSAADDSSIGLTYRLLEGGGAFKLQGNQLFANRKLDYEKDHAHIIKVEVRDRGGKTYQKQFTIRVNDWKGDNSKIRDFGGNNLNAPLFLGDLTSVLTPRKDSIGFKQGKRDRDDYYSFNLVQNGTLTVNLKRLKADADFQVLDSTGRVIGQSLTNGRIADSWTSGLLNAGIYTVHVYQGKKNAKTRYNLFLSTTPSPTLIKKETGAPFDPNGTFATGARNFDLGTIPVFDATTPLDDFTSNSPRVQPGRIGFTETYGRDVNDYIKFTLANRSSIAVSLTGLTADADLELFDSNMNSLGKATSPYSQPDSLMGYDFAPGTYYARVTPGDGSAKTEYNLSLIADAPYYGFGSTLYVDPLTGSDQFLGTVNSQDTSLENSNFLRTGGTVGPNSDEFYSFRAGQFTNDDIYITLLTQYDGASLEIYNSSFEKLYYSINARYSSYYDEYYEKVQLSSLSDYDGLKWGELYYARVVATGGYSANFGLTVSDERPTAIV